MNAERAFVWGEHGFAFGPPWFDARLDAPWGVAEGEGWSPVGLSPLGMMALTTLGLMMAAAFTTGLVAGYALGAARTAVQVGGARG